MTAITAAVNRLSCEGDFSDVPLDASASTVPKGAIVMRDTSGYGVNGSDTANYIFAGIAVETQTAGATDGAVSIKVARKGVWRFAFGAGDNAITNVGSVAYCTDNNTVDIAATPTNDIAIGRIVRYIDADTCEVDIEGYAFG